MTTLTTKALSRVDIKDATKGVVTAVVSTFGVVDLDGDVTSKSTFTEGAPVVVSAYGHTSWTGDLPIGKGSISTTDTEAIAELQFFMDTPHGSAAFNTIKELGPLQEWSYSLMNTVAHRGKLGEQEVNFLDSTDVKEVSPVLRGASIATRTLSVKAAGLKFSEQADLALRDVRWFVETAVERLTLRANEGKSFDEQISAHDQLVAELAPLKSAIDAATPAPPPDHTDELQRIFLGLIATSQGVTT